jgi:hypothetical protein
LRCLVEGGVAFRDKSCLDTWLRCYRLDLGFIGERLSLSAAGGSEFVHGVGAAAIFRLSTDRFTATSRPVQFTAAKATEFNYPVAAPHNGASRWSFTSAGARSLTVAILILRVVARLLLGGEWTGKPNSGTLGGFHALDCAHMPDSL